MAAVFRAWDHRLKVWRAIKIMLPELAEDRTLRERFAAEAHTLARLEHPHLVRVYDVGRDGSVPFLVMELVEGGTLGEWSRRFGPMARQKAVKAIWQVATGLGATHKHGVVHRDVKPQNVLITVNGSCKLGDFGVARRPDTTLTAPGTAVGTIGYMAPEQRNDNRVDHRADIYGLGATLYTVLTAKSAHDLFALSQDVNMLTPIPDVLRPIIIRCCAYRPEDRYATVEEVELALRLALDKLPADPRSAIELTAMVSEWEDPPTAPTPPTYESVTQQAFRVDEALAATAADAPTESEATTALDPVDAPLPYTMPDPDDPRDDDDDPTYLEVDVPAETPRKPVTITADGSFERASPVAAAPAPSPPPAAAPPSQPATPGARPPTVPSLPPKAQRVDRGVEPESLPPRSEPRSLPHAVSPMPARPPGGPVPVHSRSFASLPPNSLGPRPAPSGWPLEPGSAMPAPAPTTSTDIRPRRRRRTLAARLALPVALLSAFGIGAVIMLMGMAGLGAFQVHEAANQARLSQERLYQVLGVEDGNVAHWLDSEVKSQELKASYSEFRSARFEPERLRLAIAFVDEAERQRPALRWAMAPLRYRHTGRVLDDFQQTRERYLVDESAWREVSQGLTGRLALWLRLASAPPPRAAGER
ncbi:MAG: protein kinase [Myxococcales bacterium]|nr:protein kinase [Myxococcales bacterium]